MPRPRLRPLRPLFRLAAACLVLAIAAWSFSDGPTAAQAPLKQVDLTEKQVQGFIAAQKPMTDAADKFQGDASDKQDAKLQAALEAIEGLRRRSLLERGERQARFILHPVVLEYVTEQLIEEIADEISTGDLDRLLSQPLMKATARDYVFRGQERLIAAPLLNLLVATEGSPERVERRLLALLDQLVDVHRAPA